MVIKGIKMKLPVGLPLGLSECCRLVVVLIAFAGLAACTNAKQWPEEPLQAPSRADTYSQPRPDWREDTYYPQPQSTPPPSEGTAQLPSDEIYYPNTQSSEPYNEVTYPAVYPEVVSEPVPQPVPVVRAVEPVAPGGPVSQNGAVLALLEQADQHHSQSNSEAAAATLERALRIEPRNANLWYKLAAVRMEQGRFGEGEALAQKADSFATSDPYLRVASWRLIAEIRRRQGNAAGAQQADFQARQLGNTYSP